MLIPSLRGTLYAVDARTGKLRWKREPEPNTPPVNQRSYSYYSPAVADGVVYWPYQTRYGKASRGLLAAHDVKTGAVKWESPMTGATMSDGTPSVSGGRVYVGNETADRVIAYDAATGAQLWTATARLGGWQDASPTAVGGRVFIGSNNRVIARDAVTGADLWQHQSPDASFIPQNATPSAPAVVGNTLYMGFPNGRVTALDVASGAVVWSVRLPGQPYLGGVLSPPAVSGDTRLRGQPTTGTSTASTAPPAPSAGSSRSAPGSPRARRSRATRCSPARGTGTCTRSRRASRRPSGSAIR